jgi:hypothetical protein
MSPTAMPLLSAGLSRRASLPAFSLSTAESQLHPNSFAKDAAPFAALYGAATHYSIGIPALGSGGKIDRPALGRYLNVSRRSKRRSTKDLKRCVLEWMFQCGAGNNAPVAVKVLIGIPL